MSMAGMERLLSASFVQYQDFLEKSQSPPLWLVAGLPTSPSTGEAGTSCYRVAEENSRTLSTGWGGEERGAAVMEDLGLGSRQWQTLWNHHPQPALHPWVCGKPAFGNEVLKKTLKEQTSQAWSKEKRKSQSQREGDGKDQASSQKLISLKLLKKKIKAGNSKAQNIMKESQVTIEAN